MNALYDMNHITRQKVKAHAKENGYPAPSATLIPITTALIRVHKLSLICGEIDRTVDRLMLLKERIQEAVAAGSLVCVLLLKERYDEEKKKLGAYERLLEKEAPVKKEAKEGEITDDMILKAREYPFEDLLPEPLRRGRCRCPVHSGKNQMSFSVKENRGSCFSCGWKGDPIQFLIDTMGLTFPEAVRRLQ